MCVPDSSHWQEAVAVWEEESQVGKGDMKDGSETDLLLILVELRILSVFLGLEFVFLGLEFVFFHLVFVFFHLVFELVCRLFVDPGVCLVPLRTFFVELRIGTVLFRDLLVLLSFIFVLLNLAVDALQFISHVVFLLLQLVDDFDVGCRVPLVLHGAVLAECQAFVKFLLTPLQL